MNEATRLNTLSDVPWPTSDQRVRAPDTLPVTEKAPQPAADLLNRAVQGAHEAIDHLADGATPTVQQLDERVSGAQEALHAKTDELRRTGDEWVEGMRGTVRTNPLVSVAAAVALGILIARIIR